MASRVSSVLAVMVEEAGVITHDLPGWRAERRRKCKKRPRRWRQTEGSNAVHWTGGSRLWKKDRLWRKLSVFTHLNT